MKRVSAMPRLGSITERSKLAQTIRNDLMTYRRINGPRAEERRDALLWRVDQNFERLLRLEGINR